MLQRSLLVFALLGSAARAAGAQSLSEKIGGLFFYTACEQPLCLTYRGDTQATHYTFRAALASGSAIGFFTGAVGATLGALPVSATSGGVVYRFVEGSPTRVATSAGPIFAERAPTNGRGRLQIAVNTSRIAFDRARGTNMRDMLFNFDHQDLAPAGVNGALGTPAEETDILEVRPHIRLTLQQTTAVASYGLTDRIDVGVAVPVVSASLKATSTASFVNPVGPTSGLHQFGTDAAPTNRATSAISGSYSGLGDIAVRAKATLRRSESFGVAVLGDVRLATGDEDNFTGAGGVAVRALGVFSGRTGGFTPHANVGVAIRTSESQTSAALATLGFDQLAAPWATIAVDVISEIGFSGSKYGVPFPTRFQNGLVYPSTNVPDRERDDPVNLSAGAKLLVGGNSIVVNALVPLKDAGLQASRIFTVGIERTFR